MGWLQQHLETFVKPVLEQSVSGVLCPITLPIGYRHFFSQQEMTVIKNMWRSAKKAAGSKPMLLAGRDVFLFEILARREKFPTIFRPDISRLTVEHVTEDYSQHYLFDTGFLGSIPRELHSKDFSMVSYAAKTTNKVLLTQNSPQIFPRLAGARSLALKIESTPKYWRRAFYREETGIGQEFSDADEFLRTAFLTIEVFKDSSPKFVDKTRVIGASGSWS